MSKQSNGRIFRLYELVIILPPVYRISVVTLEFVGAFRKPKIRFPKIARNIFYCDIIFRFAPKLHRHRNGTIYKTVKKIKDFQRNIRKNIDKTLFRAITIFRSPIPFFELIGHTERFTDIFENVARYFFGAFSFRIRRKAVFPRIAIIDFPPVRVIMTAKNEL